METVRRYVFPIIWMAIFALIALALGRMAFFPSGDANAQAPGDEVVPVAEFDEYALVAAQPADIASTLELDATVVADEGESVLADHEGEINKIWVEDGDRIEDGSRVLQVRVEQEPEVTEPELDENGQPVVSTETPEPSYRYYTLHAKDTGTVQDLGVMEGQTLAIGDEVATLSPGTSAIVADLTPEQQLTLMDSDMTATAELPTAEEPVACEDTSIDEKEEGAGQTPTETDPMTGEVTGGETTAAQLRCPVPADTKIVPGLAVDVTVDLGSKEGVLTVPTTAVEGELANGAVYVLDEATGEPVRQEVTLGLRGDGIVEITGGLEEGDEVLEYVPGVDSADEEEMYGEEVW